MTTPKIAKLGGHHKTMPRGTRDVFEWLSAREDVKHYTLGKTVGFPPRVSWRAKVQRPINGGLLLFIRGDDAMIKAHVYSEEPQRLWEAISARWAA